MPRFIPRDAKFFDMFVEIANNLVEGAKVLSELLHQLRLRNHARRGTEDQRDRAPRRRHDP